MDKITSMAGMSNQMLMNLFDSINTRLANMCLSPAGLAIGSGSKKQVLIDNTTAFTSGGVFKSKTTAEVAFTATTMDIPANADSVQEAVYLVMLAANGTPSLKMGDIATGAGAAKIPEIPATGTVIGHVRIAVDAGATPFDASSDDLDAAHLTVAYTDVGFIAPRFDAVQ